MNIQDNVIRNALKNVYFVCGNACAGKSTIARMIADKHGFELYDMDAQYERHRAIALPEYQPNMCYHMRDFHEQWTRPADRAISSGLKSWASEISCGGRSFIKRILRTYSRDWN